MPPRTTGSSDHDEPVAEPVFGPDNVPQEPDPGEERVAEEGAGRENSLPPVVYVPCASTAPEGGELSVDLRRLEDGRTALPVYSGVDTLARCCGERQPWVALPVESLDALDGQIDFDVVLLDVDVPRDLRR